MADVQNEIENEVARDLPLALRLVFYAFGAIVGASILGFTLHEVLHP